VLPRSLNTQEHMAAVYRLALLQPTSLVPLLDFISVTPAVYCLHLFNL
jgi:hypothetical protein